MKSFQVTRFSGFFCVILFWIYGVEVEAQIVFGPQQVIAETKVNHPVGLKSTDLNGDGYLDILLVSEDGQKILWFKNTGAAGFTAHHTIATLTFGFITDFGPFDIDGDGDNDVLVAYGYKLVWYQNDSNGNFGTEQILNPTAYMRSFVVGDLDEDGHSDIVGACYNGVGSGRIEWYKGAGNGSFAPPEILTSVVIYNEVNLEIADINGDSTLDLLYNGEPGYIRWFANDGNENFGDEQLVNPSPTFSVKFSIAADLNNDGSVDLAWVYRDIIWDIVFWQLNDGFGNFAEPQEIYSCFSFPGISQLSATDFDSDGDIDLLISEYEEGQVPVLDEWDSNIITLFDNDGLGNFTNIILNHSYIWDKSFFDVVDLNNDGYKDILLANTWSNLLEWLQFGSDYNTTYHLIATNEVNGVSYIETIDINGDGHLDIIGLANYTEIVLYINFGDGSFSTPYTLYSTPFIWDVGYEIRRFIKSDLNGDGIDEVIFNLFEYSEMYWSVPEYYGVGIYYLNSYGIVEVNVPYNILLDLSNMYVADLDNDGDVDMIVTTTSGGKHWIENVGGGYFSTVHDISFEDSGFLHFADIDNDNDLDIISKLSIGPKWLVNDGLGNFSAPQTIVGLPINTHIGGFTDFNGDGYNDMLNFASTTSDVYWITGDGTGNFDNPQLITSGGLNQKIDIHDLDNDGDDDVVILKNNNLYWHENIENGSFGNGQAISSVSDKPFSFCISDLDGDGDSDITCVSITNSNIFWCENQALSESDPLPPIADFTTLPTPDAAQPDTLYICQGQTVQFFNQSQNANAFLWDFGNEATSTTTNPSYTYPEPGTYEVTLTAYSNFPQPDLCMADAGDYSFDEFPPVEVDSFNNSPDYTQLYLAFDDTGYIVMSNFNLMYLLAITLSSYSFGTLTFVAINYKNTEITPSYNNLSTILLLAQNGECIDVNILTTFDGEFNPDTSPRPAQKEGEETASQIIVVEPGFAPQINCVATVCEGTIADYSTGADCETYEWEVTGGQILSGQGTPSVTVEWTNPSLGSISLSAGCGVETCNQPTLAAVPIIGNTVVIQGQTNFCLNEVLQYTAPYFGGTQYFWSIMPPSAGTILSGQGSNLITVQWGGASATLQLTYENNLLDCGGTASLPAQIKAAYSIEPVAAVCQGHTVVISANSLFPFVWSVSGGEIVSGQNTSEITLLCTVPGNIIVSAVPVSPDVFCNFNAQTNFAVVPYPEIPVSISGNTQVCPLQTYTYTTSPPLPNTMFVWTANGGNITAGQNSPTIQVQWDPSGSPYSLSVVRETLTSPVCTSLPVELSVSSITDSPFTITGASSACPNSQKTYQITPVLSDASYIWSATPPDAALLVQGQNTGTATFAFGNTASGIVTLSATYCNLTAQLPVSIGSNPMPVITQTDTLCTGSSAQLVVSDLIGVEPYTLYQWQNSAGAVVGTNPNINISTEDVYTVQVTNASGCTGISTHRAYQYTSPMAQISGGTTSICIQSPTDIGMLAIDGTHYSFQWMLNSTPIVGANTPFLTHFGNDVEGSYSYRVLVTDTQSTCSKLSNTKTIAHILCTGGGGGTPGDTILPPPPSQCPPFAGNSLNFTISGDTENCGTVNLTLNATGSFLSYLVQWGDGIQESYSSLTTATHTYPQGELTQYTIVVSGYYIHPVTGNFCSMIYVKNHILPMVSRFDIEPACVGEAWVFQCRSYYHPSFVVTQRTWDFGDGTPPMVGNPTEPHIYAAPGTYTITLSITNGICTTISSKILTVPSLPNSSFSILGGGCVGSPVLFTPIETNHSAYYWQFGNGATAAQTTPVFTYTQAGTYQVSLQVLGSNGCLSGIQTQSLTIIEAPEQQPVTATDTVFCAGNSALLIAPSGGISYLWSNGQTSPEITVSASGNYSVQVTLPDGCLFTSPPVTIQTIPSPVAVISPASPVNYCEGDSVILQVPLNANYTYQWSENDNGQHQNTFTGPSTPSVTVTDTQTGCAAIGTATLVEQAFPATPQIAASALDICEGTVVNINITSSTNALNTYYWTNGVTGTGITVATSGQYGVWAQNQYGCQSDTSTLLNIVVNPLPDAGVFPAGCYSICEGEAIFLPPNTAQNYQWYYNGNLIPDVSGSSWIPQAEGAYWVVLGNGNCIITTDVLQLEFSTDCPGPLPVSLITFTGTVQPHANLLQWTTSAEVNNAYFTLQYSPDGNEFNPLAQIPGAGTTSTAKSYQHTHENPFPLTYYRLIQTDYDGTTRQAGEVITLIRTQPVVDFTLSHILPNPTRNTATLTYTTLQAQSVTLHLYDLTGRLLHTETLQATFGTNNYVLDMLPYPQGLYMVTLNNGVEVVSGKVVKE